MRSTALRGARGDNNPVGEQATGQVNEPERHRPFAIISVASMITVAFMGSVIVSPLYSLYQQKFGFSEITLTLIYAVYVVGNVVALLLFGQVSDQLGRKRAAVPGLALAGASAVLFLFARGVLWLFAGRLLIGLAVGILSGTGTAWLAEQHGPRRRSTATLSAATANLLGIAIGPLLGGLLAQYAPFPLRLPFVVYVTLVACVALAIAPTSELQMPSHRGLEDLHVRPRVGVPRDKVRSFAAPAVTVFAIFALGGLYFALIPSIVIRDLHETNVAIGGAVVCELALFGVAFLYLGQRLQAGTAMSAGLVLLVPAAFSVVLAQAMQSLVLLLFASALAGTALALGYRGSLQVANDIAPDERRAELISAYFVAGFIGNSIPVIGIGLISTVTDPLIASTVFASVLAACAATALAWKRQADRLEQSEAAAQVPAWTDPR